MSCSWQEERGRCAAEREPRPCSGRAGRAAVDPRGRRSTWERDPADAGSLYLPLMRGTVANLAAGPASALTGPVRRGDAATVRRHLAVLEPVDRALYRALGLVALRLARETGLGGLAAAEVERALTDEA